jgi:hypothetical protein
MNNIDDKVKCDEEMERDNEHMIGVSGNNQKVCE